MPRLGGLAAVAMYALCDLGTLPHVRWGDHQCAHPPAGVRRQGPEGRFVRVGCQPVCASVQPCAGGDQRRAGGGVRWDTDRLFQGIARPAPKRGQNGILIKKDARNVCSCVSGVLFVWVSEKCVGNPAVAGAPWPVQSPERFHRPRFVSRVSIKGIIKVNRSVQRPCKGRRPGCPR